MPSAVDPGEYDRVVTLTSDGTVCITRADGTAEQVGQLRPHLDVKLDTVTPTLDEAPVDPSWTLTATSDFKRLRDLPSQPDPSPGATYG